MSVAKMTELEKRVYDFIHDRFEIDEYRDVNGRLDMWDELCDGDLFETDELADKYADLADLDWSLFSTVARKVLDKMEANGEFNEDGINSADIGIQFRIPFVRIRLNHGEWVEHKYSDLPDDIIQLLKYLDKNNEMNLSINDWAVRGTEE